MTLNPVLIKMARQSVLSGRDKVAFQPPGGDPAAAGGAPMDPAMAGGAPPMDPAMAGGDPAAAGAPVPGGGGMTADTIRQVMMETMGQMGMGQPGMAGGAMGAGGGKANKDMQQQQMGMDLFQMKKMMTAVMNALQIPMPQDILDGPNRDPNTGMAMPAGAPGSTSDPNRVSPPMAGAPGGDGGGANSAIKPVGPIQGAFPGGDAAGGGGAEKTSAERIGQEEPISSPREIRNQAAALSAVLRSKARV